MESLPIDNLDAIPYLKKISQAEYKDTRFKSSNDVTKQIKVAKLDKSKIIEISNGDNNAIYRVTRKQYEDLCQGRLSWGDLMPVGAYSPEAPAPDMPLSYPEEENGSVATVRQTRAKGIMPPDDYPAEDEAPEPAPAPRITPKVPQKKQVAVSFELPGFGSFVVSCADVIITDTLISLVYDAPSSGTQFMPQPGSKDFVVRLPETQQTYQGKPLGSYSFGGWTFCVLQRPDVYSKAVSSDVPM